MNVIVLTIFGILLLNLVEGSYFPNCETCCYCTPTYYPVCASNGKKYYNICYFNCGRQYLLGTTGTLISLTTVPCYEEIDPTYNPPPQDNWYGKVDNWYKDNVKILYNFSYSYIYGDDKKNNTTENPEEHDSDKSGSNSSSEESDGSSSDVDGSSDESESNTENEKKSTTKQTIETTTKESTEDSTDESTDESTEESTEESSDESTEESIGEPTTRKNYKTTTITENTTTSKEKTTTSKEHGGTTPNPAARRFIDSFKVAKRSKYKLKTDSNNSCSKDLSRSLINTFKQIKKKQRENKSDNNPSCETCCNCSKKYFPVCASNNKTYDNICLFTCASTYLALNNREYITIKQAPCYKEKKKRKDYCKNSRDNCTKHCPQKTEKVCASNGNTYKNECEFKCAKKKLSSLKIIKKGECSKKKKKLPESNKKCNKCPNVKNPVCGSNGKKYSNLCNLNCARLKLKKRGKTLEEVPCKKKRNLDKPLCSCSKKFSPICASNGITYLNECLFTCHKKHLQETKNKTITISKEPCLKDSEKKKSGIAMRALIISTTPTLKDKKTPKCETCCSCPSEINPVCADDGAFYPNRCLFNCAKNYFQQKDYNMKEGLCPDQEKQPNNKRRSGKKEKTKQCVCPYILQPVCGSNGILYNNNCLFQCDKRKFAEEGIFITIVKDVACTKRLLLNKSSRKELPKNRGWRFLSEDNCNCTKASSETVCDQHGNAYKNKCFFECKKKKKADLVMKVCSVTGKADSFPCSCPNLFYPVCGTDGKTYFNECQFSCMKKILEEAGKTLKIKKVPCFLNQTRSASIMDEKYLKACNCTNELQPICASNGRKYKNDCTFQCVQNQLFKEIGIMITRIRYPCFDDDKNLFSSPQPYFQFFSPTISDTLNTPPSEETLPTIIELEYSTETPKRKKPTDFPIEVEETVTEPTANEEPLPVSRTYLSTPPPPRKPDEYCPDCCKCPNVDFPVCASDGKSYPNECAFYCRKKYLKKKRQKDIFIVKIPCFSTTTEPEDFTPTQHPDETAKKSDCPCSSTYLPICATNGIKYFSYCDFECERDRLKEEGTEITEQSCEKIKDEEAENDTNDKIKEEDIENDKMEGEDLENDEMEGDDDGNDKMKEDIKNNEMEGDDPGNEGSDKIEGEDIKNDEVEGDDAENDKMKEVIKNDEMEGDDAEKDKINKMKEETTEYDTNSKKKEYEREDIKNDKSDDAENEEIDQIKDDDINNYQRQTVSWGNAENDKIDKIKMDEAENDKIENMKEEDPDNENKHDISTEAPRCICPKISLPVCASNGKTYSNLCYYECEKKFLDKSKGLDITITKYPCMDEFNKINSPIMEHDTPSVKEVSETGCEKKCKKLFIPVCASNGKKYMNPCLFLCAKKKQKKMGIKLIVMKVPCFDVSTNLHSNSKETIDSMEADECDEECPKLSFPVCASNGKVYTNTCMFNCAKKKYEKLGKSLISIQSPCFSKTNKGNTEPSSSEEEIILPFIKNKKHQTLSTKAPEHLKHKKKKPEEEIYFEEETNPDCEDCCPCPKLYLPICASNGKTYINNCRYKCAKSYFASKGKNIEKVKCNTEHPKKKLNSLIIQKFLTYLKKIFKPTEIKDKINVNPPCEDCCTCPKDIYPVCASNGKRYQNECYFECAKNYIINNEGDIIARLKMPCFPSKPSKDFKSVSGIIAAQKKCNCPLSFQPVCGSNGKKYPNICSFNCAKNITNQITLKLVPCKNNPQLHEYKYKKESKPSPSEINCKKCSNHTLPICASDGKRYKNPCEFQCAKRRLSAKGVNIDKLHCPLPNKTDPTPLNRSKSIKKKRKNLNRKQSNDISNRKDELEHVAPSCETCCNCTSRKNKDDKICSSNGKIYKSMCWFNCASDYFKTLNKNIKIVKCSERK